MGFGRVAHTLEKRGLGVDIGSRVVKALLGMQVADRITVEAASMFAFDPSWSAGGVIRDPRALAKQLRHELDEQGIQASAAMFSIPSQLASLRWVSLPLLPPDELREAARFKVRRHLPFPVSEAYVEATLPETVDEEQHGQSLVIVVRREVVDSRADVLEYAGIYPQGAELEAQAVLRIVELKLNERSALWRDASVTIIDVGSVNTHMYVVQNRRLQFMRGIKFGSDRIARGVAVELDVPVEDVERAIGREGALLTPDGMLHLQIGEEQATVSVAQDLDKLTLEFLRLLRYFRSLHPERSYSGILDHVIVCGGLSGLRGFAEYLHEALGLRVERARPFAGMVGRFQRDTFDSIVNRQEAFTVVLGLALSSLASSNRAKGARHDSREYVWSR